MSLKRSAFVLPSAYSGFVSLAALAALASTACTGTRLYERANDAASAGQLDRAVAYDAHVAAGDKATHPSGFDQTFGTHLTRYLDSWFAALGETTAANADDHDGALRGLLTWLREQKQDGAFGARVTARLGDAARLRWDRVQSLAKADRLDDAVVTGRTLLTDATGVDAQATELKELETKASARHAAAAVAANGHDGSIVLHERLARQMGGGQTPAGKAAEASLARRTGVSPSITSANAGDCSTAVGKMQSAVTTGGDTLVKYNVTFSRCQKSLKPSSHGNIRTRTVSEVVPHTVYDTSSTLKCSNVSTGSSTVCDGGSLSTNRSGTTLTTKCHQEQTYGQKCDRETTSIPHTERVRVWNQVQEPYTVYELEALLDYEVTLTADIEGKHFETESRGTASSGVIRKDDTPPAEGAAVLGAQDDLASRLASLSDALARFARKTRAAKLDSDAIAAAASGDTASAESMWMEAALVQGEAPPGLVAHLEKSHVGADEIAAVVGGRPFVVSGPAKKALALPEISQAELDEDAHEYMSSVTLSANARGIYSGALIGGVSRYQTSAPGESSTGGFVAARGIGAGKWGSDYTCAGGSMHVYGNFDKIASVDIGVTIGAGLKLGGFHVLPVVGGATGTSSHASPSDPGFRPNADLRATALDGVYGGQVTWALPYPLNITINAQLLRTVPIPLDDLKQWTTRGEGMIGWRFLPELEILAFARYWELDTASVGPLDFFGGNGSDHKLMTVGVGIGGGFDKPPWASGND